VLAVSSVTIAFAAENRVALVIGNSAYLHAPELANPKNDAEDLATALRKLEFKVIKGLDLDKARMDRAIRDFAEAAKGARIGVFFYAGHGLQVGGRNYLIPIDAQLKTADALDFEMLGLDVVQRTMEAVSDTNVLFVDACRDNPLSRNLARAMGTRSAAIGRGLVAQEAGAGTLISFSTQPGNVALDGIGSRNSPYAAALAKHIGTQEKDLPAILIQVRRDVMMATAKRQIPWEHSALTAEIRFSAAPGHQQASASIPESGASANIPDLNSTKMENVNPAITAEELLKAVAKSENPTGVLSLSGANNAQIVYEENGKIRITKASIQPGSSIDLPPGRYSLKDARQDHFTIKQFEIKPGWRVKFSDFSGSLTLRNTNKSLVVYDESGKTQITRGFIGANDSVDLPPGHYRLKDFLQDRTAFESIEIRVGEETVIDLGR
jgi:uncharacterized caspase-like protein